MWLLLLFLFSGLKIYYSGLWVNKLPSFLSLAFKTCEIMLFGFFYMLPLWHPLKVYFSPWFVKGASVTVVADHLYWPRFNLIETLHHGVIVHTIIELIEDGNVIGPFFSVIFFGTFCKMLDYFNSSCLFELQLPYNKLKGIALICWFALLSGAWKFTEDSWKKACQLYWVGPCKYSGPLHWISNLLVFILLTWTCGSMLGLIWLLLFEFLL